MIGQTILHYKIIEKLGEGGMGIVYKALDLKLDRTLALKFLPPHLAHDEAEETRLLQEAKAASALNHPNVCTIHDIHITDDHQFIVMECVEGKTLRTVCAGSPPLDAILAYAIQIGEALQEAHAKGIVHRDIKSENIMVTRNNQIKVMDFGLAKLKGSLKLTRASSTIGTLAYMAPEQIQGTEADARSDIFSFGVVLYEMLTGHTPFRGEHEAALMYSILNEEPESALQYRPDLPPEILHVLGRALEKDPEERYQSVHDMVIDLKRLRKQSTKVTRTAAIANGLSVPSARVSAPVSAPSQHVNGTLPVLRRRKTMLIGGAALLLAVAAVAGFLLIGNRDGQAGDSLAGKKMLVVLPFENLGAADQEYFADGMTEEVTGRLAGLSGLGVIARSSAMQYKKTAKTLQQIGDELHVSYVLQGTIRYGKTAEGGTKVRISPALIKVSDGTEVWSQPYESVFSDVFKMQTDIAGQVASALGITLLQPEKKALDVHVTDNAEAYNYYVHGNEDYDRSPTERDINLSIQMYEKAIALDPNFAQAYAHLSRSHSSVYWFHYDHTPGRIAKGKELAERALAINPDLAEAHEAMGYYYYWDKLDYDNALKEFAIAQKDHPNDGHTLFAIGAVQRRQGKFDEAAASMARAAEIDPRSSEVAINLAESYRLLRKYAESEREFNRAISLSPDIATYYADAALLYLLWDGNTGRAKAILKQSPQDLKAENIEVANVVPEVEIYDGNYAGAFARLAIGPPALSNQFSFIPKALMRAEIYGLTGEREKERAAYDSARAMFDEKLREDADDSRLHSGLGIAYAGLGRKEDALREAKRGVELMPIAKEAWRGSYRIRDLARVYAMTGEPEAAIEQLQTLLAMPSDFSPQFFRLDPAWAPLRNNPKFQKLVGEKE